MRYLIIALFTLQLFAVDASLKIEKDVEQRSRFSVVDMSGGSAGGLGDKFFNTMISDLKISGHFLPDETHHRESMQSDIVAPNLKSQEYVLKYSLSQAGGLSISVKLFRATDASLVATRDYAIPSAEKYPFLAHKVISDINTILQLPDISWINRYVIYSRYTGVRKSEIIIADYTMSYKKSVIRGGLNLFPKWADKEQSSFYYTSFGDALPTLYRINITNGSKSRITSSQGMLICSDVSSSGGKLLLTMAPDGQPDIYEMSAGGGSPSRVTNFAGIDVSGKYADGDRSVVFVSNRLGYPNIFKQSLGGGSVSQVVFHGRDNNAVDTFEDKVVYASKEGGGTFNLYLTNTGGSDTRPLTSSGSNQFPRFSVDGSTVLYIKQSTGSSSIGITNLGSNQTLLFPFGGKVQSIDW
jgi:TolB protein